MIFAKSNHACWHGRSRADHDAQVASLQKAGYMLIALNVSGSPAAPVYAAAVAKKPGAAAMQAFSALTFDQFQQTFTAMAAKSMGCYLISATGPANATLYAAAFRPMAAVPVTRHRMTKADFAAFQDQRQLAGERILTVDAFGDPANPCYCAVWEPNPQRVAWSIEALDEDAATLQRRFDGMVAIRARPTHLAVTPAGRYCEVFADSRLAGNWASRTGMTDAQYQANYDSFAASGLFPVVISRGGPANSYSAIYASSDDVRPRVWQTPIGPGPVIAGVDDAVRRYMNAHNLRGMSLAIVKGTRLVYAKGYTLAEDDYPALSPRTPFRQASVSKTFAATAIWRLIQDGSLTLTRKLTDVIAIRQPDGTAPKVTKDRGSLADVTIQHLLESRSGIPQWPVLNPDWAAGVLQGYAATKSAKLPLTGPQMLSAIATLDLTGIPGDKHNVVYGNTDYFILGQVLAAVRKTSVMDAIRMLVGAPLGMSVATDASRTLAAAQRDAEARYHATVFQRHDKPDQTFWQLNPLQFLPSMVTDGRPIQPQAYGGYADLDLVTGCGGISATVVDVARLFASFSCRDGNPVLDADHLRQMLTAAVVASTTLYGPATPTDANPRSHGYHGFDGASVLDAVKGRYSIGKGGWIPAQGSWAGGWTGTTASDYVWVAAQNGNRYDQNRMTWNDGLVDANGQNGDGGVVAAAVAAAASFAGVDLFKSEYGMATLSDAAPPAPKSFIVAPAAPAVPVPGPREADRIVAPAMRGRPLLRR